ncbi:Helicase conserved C-terminal domain-containing protein [Lentzea fradiae]|uniref:Helicase conserved C-terminal domain-containing protein n=1 Tax=Lentzea fradiae TaxID=200378 RepID=A0A1G7L3E0_9PSEU|nr:helicase-related protein [Lentzea fradiae]SDF43973.1 Helicase conserved C-terminal domain-containing protein [Lentzea fradiae]
MTGRYDTGFSDRDRVLAYLHDQLVGPVDGEDEILYEKEPQHRYLTAVLFPLSLTPHATGANGPADEAEELDEQAGAVPQDDDEDPITLAGQSRPSSAGVSFMTTSRSAVTVEVRAARYRALAEDEWQREPLDLVTSEALLFEPPASGPTQRRALWDGKASVEVTWRPHPDGVIVTVVLVNRAVQEERRTVNPEDCLFQVGLRCSVAGATIIGYPAQLRAHSDEEAEELELQYRDVPVYAVGHGTAAAWDTTGDNPAWVGTSFLPVHVVPGVTSELPGVADAVRLKTLARIDIDPDPVFATLTRFVDRYTDWIEKTWDSAADGLLPRLRPAADRLRDRASLARDRMLAGLGFLRGDRMALKAFALANEVMAMQMAHSGPGLAGSPHAISEAPDPEVDHRALDLAWRPFQLGFLLMTVKGVVEEGEDRDLVDLIWFPTGGGKTEAYLGLAAFTILHRRLTLGEAGAGTAVVTRYTLRLLTSQQFQRAATMIAACELVRRGSEEELGSRPISIGLWVGGENSPNSYAEARRWLTKARAGIATDQGFQIESCPWCGTRIVPSGPDDEQRWGISATNSSFRVRCMNVKCPFHNELPMSSVDEHLYDNPPTMLVGTVDKFARTVWNEKAGVFFGTGDDPGPSLIIQDEFHLISGPLGTIVGLYEAAFDVLMEQLGNKPKIVAATATIRRADEQTKGVFGRPVALFPPAGIDASDSYFVRTDDERPGRAYLGVMPQGHTPLTALIHVAAAQLQAPLEVELTPAVHDSYSTLVVYHNSLRELGKTINLASDDIPSRLKVIAQAEDHVRQLNDDNVVELTSNVGSAQIPQRLDRLKKPHDAPGGVAFLASTNMISVGVDVGRLGVMTVVGQPKTTAEYIQATSRVGRNADRPGLVVTVYSPSKPRDRSHYESFAPYHSSLYRWVEPSSVTPFSVPARLRALHADLVVLVRHALGLSGDGDAALFDRDDERFTRLLQAFLDRVERADETELERVQAHLDDLIETWMKRIVDAEPAGGLRYSQGGRERPKLLKRFTDRGDGWATLDSMRSVDVEIQVQVRGTRK